MNVGFKIEVESGRKILILLSNLDSLQKLNFYFVYQKQ